MKNIDSVLLSPTGEILAETESPWQQTYMDDTMKVVHVNDNSKSSDLFMRYCGMSSCTPGHNFGPAVRDHYVIHYITRGEGTLFINGKTYPKNYISQYRMNKACEQLKNTSYSISEISMMIGYKDPVVFQKFFKNITGMAPSRYRKTQV